MLASMGSLVGAAEETLQPLALARNVAWWESNVEATEESGQRRAAAELAYSDALADRELFAAVEAARSNGGGEDARSLDLLRALMLPNQIADAVRSRIVELEASSVPLLPPPRRPPRTRG